MSTKLDKARDSLRNLRGRIQSQTDNVVEHVAAVGGTVAYGYATAAGNIPSKFMGVDTDLGIGAASAAMGMTRMRYANVFRAAGLAFMGSWGVGFGEDLHRRTQGGG